MFTNTAIIRSTNGMPHYVIGPMAAPANTSLTGVLAPAQRLSPAPASASRSPRFVTPCNSTRPEPSWCRSTAGAIPLGAGFFGFRQGGDQYAVGAYDTTTMRPEVKR